MLRRSDIGRLKIPTVIMAVITASLGVTAVLAGTTTRPSTAATTPASYSIWPSTTVPTVASDSDSGKVELGTAFRTAVAGKVTQIKLYKSAANVGPHVGTLWSSTGSALAKATFPTTTGAGWQTVTLATPVTLSAGSSYVVSYLAPKGRYSSTQGVFSSGKTVVSYGLTATKGVYTYGGGFPTSTWNGSSYFVDVVFVPATTATASPKPTTTTATPKPTTTATSTATPKPTTTATATATPKPTVTATAGSGTKTNCAPKPSACGYPDATTTGVPAGVTLKKSGSITASTNGQVIDGLDITGEINVTAANVVIKNSRITNNGGNWVIILRTGASNLTIQDSEITTPAGTQQDNACVFNIGDTKPTLLRVNIHGCSQGVSSGGGLIQDSYIHDMSQVPGLSHVDSIASNGGGGLTVRHNTIFNQFNQTGAVALFQDFGTQQNNLIENNLIAGGGYSIYGGGGSYGPTSNIKIINNRFSKLYWPNSGYYGPLAWFTASDPGNAFTGNYWDNDLSAVKA